jgi:DNA-binding MarR family transcriptional regulator
VTKKARLEALDRALQAAGGDISLPLLKTLIAVSLNPNLSVSELAEVIGVPQQTASRYASVLQGRYQTADSSSLFAQEPLLTHKPSITDLRRYELALTPQGSARLDKIVEAISSEGATNGQS